MPGALICHRRSVALFYKEWPHFAVESHKNHGPNSIIFQLVAEGKHWYMVVCYLVPFDAFTLESVIASIVFRIRGTELLAAVNFNTDL